MDKQAGPAGFNLTNIRVSELSESGTFDLWGFHYIEICLIYWASDNSVMYSLIFNGQFFMSQPN